MIQKIFNITGVVVILGMLIFGSFTYITHLAQSQGLSGGSIASDCTLASTTRVIVGNQASTVVLATSSLRAYSKVMQIQNATNTVSVTFSNGAAATTLNGELIDASTTTVNSRTEVAFGLNTDFPYTGAVAAITNSGSTTVLVTNCLY